MYKITGLTTFQTNALRRMTEALDLSSVTVTATTAMFFMSPLAALVLVQRYQEVLGEKNGKRGGDYMALHAVVRKLQE